MVGCTLGFGYFVLFPNEFAQLSKHAFGSAGFVVNFFLADERGYFDTAAETKPLHHLWSLSVEEQFYVCFPLLCMTLWKIRLNLIFSFTLLALFSFGFAIKAVSDQPIAAFYWPHVRAWQLLTGAILALYTALPPEISCRGIFAKHLRYSITLWLARKPAGTANLIGQHSHALSIVGILLIAIAMAGVTSVEKGYPGWTAIFPTLGGALLIAAGRQGVLNAKLLSRPMMVKIGLISFPLYLWHYPLLSYAHILYGALPAVEVRIALIILAVFLAWATYILVEKPIRFGVNGKGTVSLLTLTTAMLVLGGLANWVRASEGLPSRETPWLLTKKNGDIGNDAYFHRLFNDDRYFYCEPDRVLKDSVPMRDGHPRCLQSKAGVPVDVAIFGDSHAEHLFPGLADTLASKNVAYYIHGRGPPFENIGEIDRLIAFISEQKSLRAIIVSSNWHSRLLRVGEDSSLQKEVAWLMRVLSKTGKDIYLSSGTPTFSIDPHACKYDRLRLAVSTRCSEDRSQNIDKQYRLYADMINRISNEFPNVHVIPTMDYICDSQTCQMALGQELLFRDRNHLTFFGSEYIAKRIVQDFPQLLGAK